MKDKIIEKQKLIIKKQREYIKYLKQHYINYTIEENHKYKKGANKLESELYIIESELAALEAEQSKSSQREAVNSECQIDKLEFNCGYNNPCVMCPNYIPYVKD